MLNQDLNHEPLNPQISFANAKVGLQRWKGWSKLQDSLWKWFIRIVLIVILTFLVSSIGFILYKSIYFFHKTSFLNFFSSKWSPSTNQFGIWRFILGSFFVLLFSLSLAVPLTIFASLYICFFLRPSIKKRLIQIIQLLAGIPSVVFGLFSLSILGSFFQQFGAPTQTNLLVSCITLAFMGLPIMMALSISALEEIPHRNFQSSLSLGISKPATAVKVALNGAKVKIIAAIMLGVARIIGETMAVLMICGNDPAGPNTHGSLANFFFSSFATLSSVIGLNILQVTNQFYESALYAIGIILLIAIVVLNLFVVFLQNMKSRSRLKLRHYNLHKYAAEFNINLESQQELHNKIKSRKWLVKMRDGALYTLFISSTLIVIGFTLLVLITIVYRGISGLNGHDLIAAQNNVAGHIAILPIFLTTALVVLGTLFITVPLAIMIGICINEYMDSQKWVARGVNSLLTTLASLPSILYGIFGLFLFITLFHIPQSIFAASLTLTVVILPMMIRNVVDGLDGIPLQYRQVALALGLNKWMTIRKAVLPNAWRAISTGVILAIARIIGESAPVYLTLGTTDLMPSAGFLSPGSTMATQILTLWRSGTSTSVFSMMYEIAFFIIVLVLLLNFLANYLKTTSSNQTKFVWKDRWQDLKLWIIKCKRIWKRMIWWSK